MSFLVISSSLNPFSKSRILAHEAYNLLKEHKEDPNLKSSIEIEWLDLKELELPHCDGASAYGHPNVSVAAKKIKEATCIIFAVPIYNYDVGSSAKNLLELTGKAWENKTVGFLCAAGGQSSYMSVMAFANSMMLDFRCLIIPRFVYTDDKAFENNKLSDESLKHRVKKFVDNAIKLAGANM